MTTANPAWQEYGETPADELPLDMHTWVVVRPAGASLPPRVAFLTREHRMSPERAKTGYWNYPGGEIDAVNFKDVFLVLPASPASRPRPKYRMYGPPPTPHLCGECTLKVRAFLDYGHAPAGDHPCSR